MRADVPELVGMNLDEVPPWVTVVMKEFDVILPGGQCPNVYMGSRRGCAAVRRLEVLATRIAVKSRVPVWIPLCDPVSPVN